MKYFDFQKFEMWRLESFSGRQHASYTTVIILLQLSAGEADELAHNEMVYRQNCHIKGTRRDHVNFSGGFDPTNDLLINTMLS